jgi:predicted O-linked N-acetylglucosamine transferase (SPINDLY family)
MFGIWMRILAQVPDSVLWLLQDNVDAAANLRREATARGVNPRRLIFAPRIAPAEHLARQRLADLFLDTSPYSAHTTCSDALFLGLPVLSFYGPTFPAHVAVSLLNAVGMSDLATQSLGEYEARALFLARNRDELQHVKAKLMQNREGFPLFNTARFTRNLEQAYREMLALHDQGMPPRSFAVEESL